MRASKGTGRQGGREIFIVLFAVEFQVWLCAVSISPDC